MSQKELEIIKNAFNTQYFEQDPQLDYFIEKDSENEKEGSFIINIIDERDFPPTIKYSRYKLSSQELPVKSKKETLKVGKHGVAYVEYDATFQLLYVYYEHKPAIMMTKVTPLWFNSLRFTAMKSTLDVVDLINRATRSYKCFSMDEVKIEMS